MEPFFAAHTKAELFAMSNDKGLGLSRIDDLDDALASEQWRGRDFWRRIDDQARGLALTLPGPMFATSDQTKPARPSPAPCWRSDVASSDWRRSAPMSPLADLKVVDFTKFLPGPYCTWMLGDLGAQIVRIEHPRELAKQAQVFGWDKQAPRERRLRKARDVFARNKKSLLIDPGHAESAAAAITSLIKASDILVEDYRPGVMETMGWGYEAVRAINPRIVYCSLTLCGQTGPYRSKPGHDPIALSIGGDPVARRRKPG